MRAEESNRRLRRARAVSLVTLAGNAAMALFLPAIGLWREPEPTAVALGAIGIALFVAALAAVLHALVTPWLGAAVRRRAVIALAAASVLSVPLVGPVGGPWPTWAWLAACMIGIVPVLTRWPAAAGLSALIAAGAAGVAAANGHAAPTAVLIAAGAGLGIASINLLQVWFWDLLVQAERGRAAQARLAASEERLRFARDVHDLLGHRLSVIALKAELAQRLAAADPGRAAGEAAEVRRLAASALAELRAVVHGYRRVDLPAELTAIEQVLRASGVRCTVTGPPGDLAEPVAAALAAVLREATTNVLRHSSAAWCTIDIGYAGPRVRMTVTNDGVVATVPDRHSHGLQGLAERLAEAGGVLRTSAAGGRFTVEAVVGSQP